jgi:hypothetical protein
MLGWKKGAGQLAGDAGLEKGGWLVGWYHPPQGRGRAVLNTPPSQPKWRPVNLVNIPKKFVNFTASNPVLFKIILSQRALVCFLSFFC